MRPHDGIVTDGQAGGGIGGVRRRSHIKLYPIIALACAGGQAAAIDSKGELRGAGGVTTGLHTYAGVAIIGGTTACHDRRVFDGKGGIACSAFDVYSVRRTRNFQSAVIAAISDEKQGICADYCLSLLCIHINPIVACDGIHANQFDSQGN